MKKVLFLILATSVISQANFLSDWFGKIEKIFMERTSSGYVFTPKRIKTEYSSRIIWGAGYGDHTENDPVKGIAVEAFGNGWKYATITDEEGVFVVPVKPNSPFTIRASSGDEWCEYNGTLAGVPIGTLKNDKL